MKSPHPLGTFLGDFELLVHLARGKFGDVYKAIYRPNGKAYALKVLRADTDDVARMRFQDEFMLLSTLDCPHLVRAYHYGEIDGQLYFSSDFHEGGSFHAYLLDNPGHSTMQALVWCIQICRAVESLHDQGVLHRDLKPGNICIDKRTLELTILDLGSSKRTHVYYNCADRHYITPPARRYFTEPIDRRYLGTPSYRAPEAVDIEPDIELDVYSIGAIAHRLFTRLAPDHPAAKEARARIKSRDLLALVLSMLDPDPAMRPSVGAVLENLELIRDEMIADEAAEAEEDAACISVESRTGEAPSEHPHPHVPQPNPNAYRRNGEAHPGPHAGRVPQPNSNANRRNGETPSEHPHPHAGRVPQPNSNANRRNGETPSEHPRPLAGRVPQPNPNANRRTGDTPSERPHPHAGRVPQPTSDANHVAQPTPSSAKVPHPTQTSPATPQPSLHSGRLARGHLVAYTLGILTVGILWVFTNRLSPMQPPEPSVVSLKHGSDRIVSALPSSPNRAELQSGSPPTTMDSPPTTAPPASTSTTLSPPSTMGPPPTAPPPTALPPSSKQPPPTTDSPPPTAPTTASAPSTTHSYPIERPPSPSAELLSTPAEAQHDRATPISESRHLARTTKPPRTKSTVDLLPNKRERERALEALRDELSLCAVPPQTVTYRLIKGHLTDLKYPDRTTSAFHRRCVHDALKRRTFDTVDTSGKIVHHGSIP